MPIILNSPVQGKNDVPSVAGSPVAVKSYTTAQVNALTGQDPGTIVWDSDVLGHKVYSGSAWVRVSSSNDLRPHVRRAGGINPGAPPSGALGVDGEAAIPGERYGITTNVGRPWEVGIYVASAGLWTRPDDFKTGDHAEGALFLITQGSKAGQVWKVENVSPTDVINTDNLTISVLFVGGEIISGQTVFKDAATNTSITMAGIAFILTHNGAPSFIIRGETDGTTWTLLSERDNGYIGAAFPSPLYYRAIRRVVARQFATLHTSVAFSATPDFNVNALYLGGAVFSFTLTGNVTGWTIPAPAASVIGEEVHSIEVTLFLHQDAVGGWLFAGAPANVLLAGGAFTLSPGALATDSITLRWDRLLSKYRETSRSQNLL